MAGIDHEPFVIRFVNQNFQYSFPKGIKPGIYNIYLAKAAETNNNIYEGLILLIDKQEGVVYQQVNKDFIAHKLELFKASPPIGKNVSIQYENEKLNLIKIDAVSKKRIQKI